MIKAIIFDVDGTLTNTSSWIDTTKQLGGDINFHLSLYQKLKNKELNLKGAEQELLKHWQSTGNANIEFMENMFKIWDLREDAIETISYLKKKYKILLISGSMDLYVKCIAEKLEIQDYYSNSKLTFDNQGNLVDLKYDTNQSGKKLIQFNEYCSNNDLNYEECAAIGDDDNNEEIFKLVKYSILIQSDSTKDFDFKVYKKIDKLSELKSIL